jgi:hypothetical protein
VLRRQTERNDSKTMLTKTTLSLALLLCVASHPAAAQVEVPAEWVGIWEIQIELYDCDTDQLLFSTTSTDTICEGDAFEEPDDESGSVTCTGTADADSYTMHCEGSEVVMPGCTANYEYNAEGTRSGDSYQSTAIFTVAYAGDCGVPDSCQRTEIVGTRISSDPGPCEQTPVERRSWDTVRSLYR